MNTNVIAIRMYADGSLALTINGRDYPDLKSFDMDTEHKRVMLDVGYGVLNVLEGDAELPRPERRVEMCGETDAPHRTILDQRGDLVCGDCNMPTDGTPPGYELAKEMADRIAALPVTLHNRERGTFTLIDEPAPGWWSRMLRALRHR